MAIALKVTSQDAARLDASPVVKRRRQVLRLGYAAILVLLMFASFEAYRIQENASSHNLNLYRRYAQQDEATTEWRTSIWLAGNRVREFLIDSRPDNVVRLASQLRELRAQSDRALKRLEDLGALPDKSVQTTMQEFWEVLSSVIESTAHATQTEKYEWVRQEIAPRRVVLSNVMRNLLVASQTEMQHREAEIAAARRQSGVRLILVLGLCIALALGAAHFSVTYSDGLERTSAQQYEALEQTRRELRELSARLVDIEEEGRKRLARELHDGLGQTLAILQIEISNALALPADRWAECRALLARARELAQTTVQSVRGMSHTLRPALLDDLGLVPALEWLLENFMRRSGVTCEFHTSSVADDLSDPVKTCVYRVVQEAIHNCEKHAHATRVTVTIDQSPGQIQAEIKDNGRGFNVEAGVAASRQSGLGIVVMRERAERLGGSLLIESAPAAGTRLRLSVPLSPTAPASEPAAVPVKI
jgi:signal transduction histidine kinase